MEDLSDLESLMQEPSGGHNYGARDGYSLDTRAWVASEARMRGGMCIVWPNNLGTKGNPGGAVLGDNVYVDPDTMRDMVEERLGASLEDVQWAYSRIHRTPEEQALKDRVDAILYEAYLAEANMYQLAKAIGLNQRTMNRAIVRVRSARAEV